VHTSVILSVNVIVTVTATVIDIDIGTHDEFATVAVIVTM